MVAGMVVSMRSTWRTNCALVSKSVRLLNTTKSVEKSNSSQEQELCQPNHHRSSLILNGIIPARNLSRHRGPVELHRAAS